jgi:hypothetical protein
MNAKDFFEQHSIETINKKTRISPISLRFIKNREFEKIPRVKFLGFVKIIEKEFKVDLSELIEEYNQRTGHLQDKDVSADEKAELKEPKKQNTLILFVLAVVLFSLGAYLLYNKYNSKHIPNAVTKNAYTPGEENISGESNQTSVEKDSNSSPKTFSQTFKTPLPATNSQPAPTLKNPEKTVVHQSKQTTGTNEIKIIPNEKVWFRAVNLDSNKTVQYLTSTPKILNGSDWYIKFGHGNITISYGNQTITPKTKKIVRLLFKNGKFKYLKYPNRYEK